MPFAFQILALNSSTILWDSSINIILLILKIIKINKIQRWHIWTPASESPSSWLSQMCLVLDWILESAISSVQFSRLVVSKSSRPHESQHAKPPCPSPTPGVYPNPCPSSQWCHPAISPLSFPSPPVPNSSQHQGLFQWVNSSHEVAKVLEFQLQYQSFQWTPRTELL